MNKKILKRIKVIFALSVVCAISIGCSNTEAANQNQNALEETEQLAVTDTMPIEETLIKETPIEETPIEKTPIKETSIGETLIEENSIKETLIEESLTEESLIKESSTEESSTNESSINETPLATSTDETVRDNTHNIFNGTMGQTEIQMRISRKENALTAAYITRTNDEAFFEGEMKNPAEFELTNKEGEYLKCTIKDSSINGTGLISGENVEIALNLSTFFPMGYDYENYYSGVAATGGSSAEVEAFSQQIKESVKDKEKFLKLFKYPLVIRIEGEAVTVNSEADMAEQYDTLIAQTDFLKQIENMYTKYLFVDYQGICVENGIIWFDKDSSGDYKIFTLNIR